MTITYEGVAKQTRQIIHHHAVLRRGLERRAGALCEAVESGVPFERQMRILREYITGEILPHAEAEERTLYQTAATEARGRDLVRTLTAQHHALAYLAGGSSRARMAARPPPLGKDRHAVRRARGQGERPAAARAHPLRRRPGRPARGHARAATAEARIGPLARFLQHGGAPVTVIVPEGGEIIMYPDSALSAGQLAIIAVVAVVSLAAWLIAVFLAARQPRGTSAAVNAGPREEETGATVTQLPSGAGPADKAAA